MKVVTKVILETIRILETRVMIFMLKTLMFILHSAYVLTILREISSINFLK